MTGQDGTLAERMAALADEMETGVEYGTMPGVRRAVRRTWAARLRALLDVVPGPEPEPDSVAADLRCRLACVVEATYWDRPYDTRIAAIRGMCDLTTNGMTPAPEPETRTPSVLISDIDRQRELGWPDFHPEDYCHRCGGRNISWWTDPDTWNPVMRPDGPGSFGLWQEIICPQCFAELRQAKFSTATWELRLSVPAPAVAEGTDQGQPIVIMHDEARMAPELVALLHDWDANDEDDNYSKGMAATDLRAALHRACVACRTGESVGHNRRCPERLDRTTPAEGTDAAHDECRVESVVLRTIQREANKQGGVAMLRLARAIAQALTAVDKAEALRGMQRHYDSVLLEGAQIHA